MWVILAPAFLFSRKPSPRPLIETVSGVSPGAELGALETPLPKQRHISPSPPLPLTRPFQEASALKPLFPQVDGVAACAPPSPSSPPNSPSSPPN